MLLHFFSFLLPYKTCSEKYNLRYGFLQTILLSLVQSHCFWDFSFLSRAPRNPMEIPLSVNPFPVNNPMHAFLCPVHFALFVSSFAFDSSVVLPIPIPPKKSVGYLSSCTPNSLTFPGNPCSFPLPLRAITAV